MFQCNHSKFQYRTFKPGFSNANATSYEKVGNSNVENSWKDISVLNNIKRGFKVLLSNDKIKLYQSWLYYWDWSNTFTDRTPQHKMVQWLHHMSIIHPPKLYN